MASLSGDRKRPRPCLPLHDAVRRYDVSRLKYLVDAGSDLTVVDDYGRTPLHLALFCTVVARPGSGTEVHEVITTLLSADEDERNEALCARSDDGLTPIHLAAKCGSSKLMDVLLNSIDEEILPDVLEMRSHLNGELWNGNWGKKMADGQLAELDIEHMSPLHLALERLNPNEDEDDDDDVEPLSDAARAEAVEMARLLIRRGADVNARDANGRAPIHQAVGAGLQDVTEMLLEAGADPTLGFKAIGMANNVLHQAVLRGNESMVRALMRAAPHLDVDAEGQNGLTPLCLAARSNKESCARALVQEGADPKSVSTYGKSAIDIARINKRASILELFGEEP